jgi:hypothetical protein
MTSKTITIRGELPRRRSQSAVTHYAYPLARSFSPKHLDLPIENPAFEEQVAQFNQYLAINRGRQHRNKSNGISQEFAKKEGK